MTDIIEFEDKRKLMLGKQKKLVVEKLDEQAEASPDSDNYSQENLNSELDLVNKAILII